MEPVRNQYGTSTELVQIKTPKIKQPQVIEPRTELEQNWNATRTRPDQERNTNGTCTLKTEHARTRTPEKEHQNNLTNRSTELNQSLDIGLLPNQIKSNQGLLGRYPRCQLFGRTASGHPGSNQLNNRTILNTDTSTMSSSRIESSLDQLNAVSLFELDQQKPLIRLTSPPNQIRNQQQPTEDRRQTPVSEQRTI